MWTLYLRVAARALRARAGRSLLTVTSITLGSLSVVLMTSLASSGLATLVRGIEDLGAARMVFVSPKVPEHSEDKAQRPRPFTPELRDAVTTGVPHLRRASLWAALGKQEALSDGGKGHSTDVVATDTAFFEIFRMSVARGRALSDEDEHAAAGVCVVGPKLRAALWPARAVGRSLSVGALRCRVVGELDDNDRFGMHFGFDWNDVVIVPFALASEHDTKVGQQAELALVTDAPEANDVVMRILNTRMVKLRDGIDDFTLMDLSSVVRKFDRVFALMQGIVGLIAAVALVIGGVGVMNMMLVSVNERVAEIGVRRALGATARMVKRQFVVEAALLAGLGGALGVALGVSLAWVSGWLLVRVLPTWLPGVSLPAALAAFTASLTAGVVFGWLPARRAAQMSPMEAMRR
ncbi:MAG: ABC transporter permease [Polyangiaceae bacterium]